MFLGFLAGRVRRADALYILGDLFEAWIGDDDLDDPYNARIVSALRAAADAGVRIAFMHGNRDFLIGERFAAAAGIRLLADPHDLLLPEWSFVLAHGDALCLDDNGYMAFRARVRSPEWQRRMLARPRWLRRIIARYFRWRSRNMARAVYADLNPAATDDFLRDHAYATFIHGHTHRPATHDHIVDGIHVERWVLADWHEDRGECLAWDGETLTREAVLPENRP